MIKKSLNIFAAFVVLFWALSYRISLFFINDDDRRKQLFTSYSQRVSRFAGIKGVYIRRKFFEIIGCDVSSDCHIEFAALFSSPDIVIRSGAYIGAFTTLGSVTVGEKTMIADGVRIPSGPHTHGTTLCDVPMADQKGSPRHITIGKNCWIGANAVILADVQDNCIVAAGAVVTTEVSAGDIVGGVPAKVLKTAKQRIDEQTDNTN